MATSSAMVKSDTKGLKTIEQRQVQCCAFGNNKLLRSTNGCKYLPKFLSIADLNGAGKIIKSSTHIIVSLVLESVDIANKVWNRHQAEEFDIEQNALELGAFDVHLEQPRKEIRG